MSGTTPDRGPLRERIDALIAEAKASGEPLAWFERLYAAADGDTEQIPWADRGPNPHLVTWLDEFDEQVLQELFADASNLPTDDEVRTALGGLQAVQPGSGFDSESEDELDEDSETEPRALVVGCGLGQDAALLAENLFDVTAFDLSASAIQWARRLHAAEDQVRAIDFQVQDLLNLPDEFRQAFDLVVEIYTLQAMPREMVADGIKAVAECVAPGGTLVVICRGRDVDEPTTQVPHPLSREDLAGFEGAGLEIARFEDFMDDETPAIRRFRVVLIRPESS